MNSNSTAFSTVATSFVVGEHEARLAGALETAGCIGAGAELADVGFHRALVDIWEGRQRPSGINAQLSCNYPHPDCPSGPPPMHLCVHVCVCVSLTYALVVLHLVAWRTDASEGSVQILTGSWRAGARQTHAFVDICGKRDDIKKYINKFRCLFKY